VGERRNAADIRMFVVVVQREGPREIRTTSTPHQRARTQAAMESRRRPSGRAPTLVDVTISAGDFWMPVNPPDGVDPWTNDVYEELNTRRLALLIDRPDPAARDLDTALALMDLVRDDLQLSGTSGDQRISDMEMRSAVRALERTSARAGHEFKLPFRDHASWRSYWIRKNASGPGGWQARRDLLSDLFDGPYAAMMAAQDRVLGSTLMEAASEHDRLGWPEVDTEIGELRRHFRSARTPQDYRAVGNDCVHLTEALSRKVYVHAEHTPKGEEEPPVARTKVRLERYIESRLPGRENAEMRKYARSAIELAQAVKHRGAPTRTEAGVVADAVIALANMLRRLAEDR
jgi:hypothetical protein